MKLSIRHETHYEYSAPLQYALQHLCLTPQANAHQALAALVSGAVQRRSRS